MTPRVRKFALTAHITFSIGWLGSIAAFLALSIAGLKSHDVETVRSSYLSMNLIGRFVIIPMSLAALATGLVQSLGTPWGLFRYYWVAAKFVLTLFATIALLLHQFTAVAAAAKCVSITSPGTLPDVGSIGVQLVVNAAAGLVILLVITAIAIYKPWGKIRNAERNQQAQTLQVSTNMPASMPLGVKIFIAVIGLIAAAFIVLHLLGGGLGHHHL